MKDQTMGIADQVMGNGKVAQALEKTEPGGSLTRNDRNFVIAVADGIAIRDARPGREQQIMANISRRGGDVRADERAAFAALLRRAARTDDEREVCRRAMKLRCYLPEALPEYPTPERDAEITDALAKNAVDEQAVQRELGTLESARASHALAQTVVERRDRAVKLRDAEQRYAEAVRTWEVSRARYANLEHERQEARRDAALQKSMGG